MAHTYTDILRSVEEASPNVEWNVTGDEITGNVKVAGEIFTASATLKTEKCEIQMTLEQEVKRIQLIVGTQLGRKIVGA